MKRIILMVAIVGIINPLLNCAEKEKDGNMRPAAISQALHRESIRQIEADVAQRLKDLEEWQRENTQTREIKPGARTIDTTFDNPDFWGGVLHK